ncbi:alkaline phosphatase PhoX [Shinella sp. S4-D37]|uniref:alkaline phosphatase PhoX n=1 Tax=Shinella sp. S4-D37 TaxID=3161999 RepID=UPI0034653543
MSQILRNADVPQADRRPKDGFGPAYALACRVERDSRTVTYCSDGGHLYKFVANRARLADGRKGLDDGTLHVAHFSADDEEDWMPVAFGAAPLVMENGTLTWRPVAARPGDIRPETPRPTRLDGLRAVAADARAGTVRLRLSGESDRFSHVVEIIEAGGDFAAARARWEVLSTRTGR